MDSLLSTEVDLDHVLVRRSFFLFLSGSLVLVSPFSTWRGKKLARLMTVAICLQRNWSSNRWKSPKWAKGFPISRLAVLSSGFSLCSSYFRCLTKTFIYHLLLLTKEDLRSELGRVTVLYH